MNALTSTSLVKLEVIKQQFGDHAFQDFLRVINNSPKFQEQVNTFFSPDRDGGITIGRTSGGVAQYDVSGNDAVVGQGLNNTNGLITFGAIALDYQRAQGWSVGYGLAESFAHELGHAFDTGLGNAAQQAASLSNGDIGRTVLLVRSEAKAELNSLDVMSEARRNLRSDSIDDPTPLPFSSGSQVTGFPRVGAAIQSLLGSSASTNLASTCSVSEACLSTVTNIMGNPPYGYYDTYFKSLTNNPNASFPLQQLKVGTQGDFDIFIDDIDPNKLNVVDRSTGKIVQSLEPENSAAGAIGVRVVQYDTDGVAYQSATAIADANGSITTIVRDVQNITLSTAFKQTYDDGTTLTTTRYASGAQTRLSTDTLGGTKQIDLPDPSNPQIQTTTTRNASGAVTSTSSITALLDENNHPVANTYSLIDRDGAGTITATGERVYNPVTGSYTTQQITSATPENPNGVASTSSTDANGVTTPAPDAAVVNGQGTTGLSETALKQVGNAVGVFNSAYNFLQAVQTGMPLPIIAGGITLFNAIDPTALPPQLTGVASAVGAYTSLISLKGAINRGDFSGVVTSGLNTFVAGVSTFAYLAGFSSLAAASTANAFGGLATAANGLSSASFGGISVLSYLNIANDLINGNIAGAIGNAEFDMRLQGTAAAQYLNRTEWLNATEGFFVPDKNVNGTLDNAEELFSNSAVVEGYRGVASLDYANGIFSQNGQVKQMSTLSLKAETIGRSYVQKPDGIQINTNADQPTLRVRQLHDLNNLQPNANYYENRSCLRPYLLGCSSNRYLKTRRKCNKAAFTWAREPDEARKQTFLGNVNSQRRLYTGVGNYEINSYLFADFTPSLVSLT